MYAECRILRGATLQHPPQSHRFPTWCLHLVLSALTQPPFEPYVDVTLKWVQMKTIFLMAVISARCISELSALSVQADLCIFHKDKVVLQTDPTFLPKVVSHFHSSQEICHPSFCLQPSHSWEKEWHTLDVCRVFKAYLHRTESIRQTESLFINIAPLNAGKRMAKSTIIVAVRSCILKAYKASHTELPKGITAHSVRSAATNAAYSSNASVEDVCKAATWSSVSMFV